VSGADRREREQRLAEPRREPAPAERCAGQVERREQGPVAAAVAQVLEQLEVAAGRAVEQEQVARAVAAQRAELRERGGLELRDHRDQRGGGPRIGRPLVGAESVRQCAHPLGHGARVEVAVADPADLHARRQVLLRVARHDLARTDPVELGVEQLAPVGLGGGELAGREIEVRNPVSPLVAEHRGP
jgi:hypothetical protein